MTKSLSVSNTHDKYNEMLPKWKKIRAVDGGEDTVHEAGTLLLPMLPTQDAPMYEKYKQRARFLPAFPRTVQGLSGTVMRKDPIYKVEPIEEYVSNIDSSGTTLEEYAAKVLDELLKPGWCGTLVDYVPVDDLLSVAEAEESNMRPNFAFYEAEDIINWKYDTVNNVWTLVMLVLKEVVEAWEAEFDTKEQTQYRVLRLDEETGNYTQQLYIEKDEQGFTEEDVITPMMDGAPLKKIPFFFHGYLSKPPLYDLCTTNVKWYQLKADHNHALHYIGLPTPIFPGVDPEDPNKPNCIGPEQIIYLSDYRAKPFYLTYGGEGLASVEKELTELEKHMAFLGANMLAPNENVQETATKASIRRASETSALSLLAENESQTLTEALQFFAWWAGVDHDTAKDEVGIEMNKDFNPSLLTGQDLVALVSSWQQGAYSKETLFWNLQRGEIIPGETDFDEEEERIQNEMPAAGNNPFDVAAQEAENEAKKKAAEEAAAAKKAEEDGAGDGAGEGDEAGDEE